MKYDNLTLLTDFYALTMMQGYLETNKQNEIVVFDVFYRINPQNGGYAIVAGLEQIIDYIKNINFSEDDILYLRSLNKFNEKFLSYLKDFKFTGDIYAIPEGTVVFPKEPLLTIKAPIIEAQLLEACLLNILNHQSLIATKASRIVLSAGGDNVLEFGLRRAQGPDAGIYGARAAIIAGCSSTSNVLCGKMFNIPISGTNAHSWVMSFSDEITAFREYAKLYPNSCILLVDTYDTLNSGVPNAIKVFKELKDSGHDLKFYGVRLDSGDLVSISKKVRKQLDDAGFKDAVISASNELDENSIYDLKLKGAEITVWGVGTNLITSKDWSSFGGVYKLSAIYDNNGNSIPKIKVSNSTEKRTNPGEKKIYRIYNKDTKKIETDLLCLSDELITNNNDLIIFNSEDNNITMNLKKDTFILKDLLVPIFKNGNCVYNSPNILDIQQHCKEELESLSYDNKKIKNPDIITIYLSSKLNNLKKDMLKRVIDKN